VGREEKTMLNVPKMIVFDLDNTLLKNDKTMSLYTVSVLHKCRVAGIYLCFATARPIRSVKEILRFYNPDIMVYHNGAVIEYMNHSIETIGIPNAVVVDIINKVRAMYPNCEIGLEASDALYTNYDVQEEWKGFDYIKFDKQAIPSFPSADKVLVNLKDDIDTEVLRLCLPNEYYLEIANDQVGMIMNRDATKIKAIEKICEKELFDLGQVIAFGDDDNDLEMIRNCGIGIAVANANNKVRAVADEICGSNEDDGVAQWLQFNLLSGREVKTH
jgi:Cof subfamily protein (haloacid dehalogenase superfamily)